jgi:hypothetical protein
MLRLALGLAVFRSIYLNGVPADVLPHDAAAVLYDTIVRFLRAGLRTILVLALVLAAGAFLTGQSVGHRGPLPPEHGAGDCLAAGRRRAGGAADRPGGDLGGRAQAGVAHRRRGGG